MIYFGNPSKKKGNIIILIILKDEWTGRHDIKLPLTQHLLCVRQFARHFTFTYYICLHNEAKKIPTEADAFSKGLKESKAGEQRDEWKQRIRVKFNTAIEECFYILVPNVTYASSPQAEGIDCPRKAHGKKLTLTPNPSSRRLAVTYTLQIVWGQWRKVLSHSGSLCKSPVSKWRSSILIHF